MSDAALLSRWDALMVSVEEPYAAAIVVEKDRYITQAAETFKTYRRLEDRDFDYHSASMVALAQKYQGLALRLAVAEALAGQKSRIASLQRRDGWDQLFLYLLSTWMRDFGAARAKQSAVTTRADLQRIVERAVAPDTEFNPVQVATDLLKAKFLSPPRARLSATTEVHNAMMFASQEGASKVSRDNGVTLKKRWVPVADERTRINHAATAGVAPIAIDADFIVGGERMQRPGDPRASAANVVRCRCVLAYETPE